MFCPWLIRSVTASVWVHDELFRINSVCGVKGGGCVSSAEEKAGEVFNSCSTPTPTTPALPTTNSGVLVVCWGCNVWHRYSISYCCIWSLHMTFRHLGCFCSGTVLSRFCSALGCHVAASWEERKKSLNCGEKFVIFSVNVVCPELLTNLQKESTVDAFYV